MKQKQAVKLLILCLLILMTPGCGKKEDGQDRANSGNSVDEVISGQIDDAGAQSDDKPSEDPDDVEESKLSEPQAETRAADIADDDFIGEVDYDLTDMSRDMVYATVYQMMTDPDSYVGKTIRMDGIYYSTYYDVTGQYYHYCVIEDALACCSQGLEFVWGDGSRVYPDEYPEENTAVVVQGVFDHYQDVDGYMYCRLKDAALKRNNS